MQLVADDRGVLHLLRERPRIDYQLILKVGWQIASATADERAVLKEHGFGSGRVQ